MVINFALYSVLRDGMAQRFTFIGADLIQGRAAEYRQPNKRVPVDGAARHSAGPSSTARGGVLLHGKGI